MKRNCLLVIFTHSCFDEKFMFLVLPQIAPFTFGDDTLNAGELASATCSITKGDSPITIVWYFNETEIESGDEVVVSKIGRKISTLSIESVHASHMGQYSCVAKNAAGATNFTTFLHVKGLTILTVAFKTNCFPFPQNASAFA